MDPGSGVAGRRDALAALVGFVTGPAGSTAATVVTGEAGLGKSRLVAAVADAAGAAGVTVLQGWCLPLADGLPLLPLADVLREVTTLDGGAAVAAALDACPAFVRTEITRLLPEWEEAGAVSSPLERDDGWRRQRLYEAARRLLVEVAHRRRIAVVVEDLHWADPSSLGFLTYVLSPAHTLGIPILMTCRSDDDARNQAEEWVDGLTRNARVARWDLAPLTRDETADQIELMTGTRPDDAMITSTFDRAEGNPFFTEQLVAFAESRPGRDRHGVLPAGLRSLLLSRAARVDDRAREVLQVLALAGRPLAEDELARMCGAEEKALRESLVGLLAARLLRPPDATGRQTLRHALLAEAIGDDVVPGARREWHARIARELESAGPDAAAAEVAAHWAAAGDEPRELGWRVAAAHHAEGVFAYAQAYRHWRRVIELHGRDTTGGLSDDELADAYVGALRGAGATGVSQAATDVADEAEARLGSVVSGDLAVRLWCWIGWSRGASALRSGVAALETAIGIGARLPPTEDYVRALGLYGWFTQFAGDLDNRAILRRGLAAAREIGSLPLQQSLGTSLIWTEAFLGRDPEPALQEMATMLAVRTDDADATVEAAVSYVHLAFWAGHLHRGVQLGVPVIERAVQDGQADSYRVRVLQANVHAAHLELGDVEAAASFVGPGPDGGVVPDWILVHVWMTSGLDVCRGRPEAAAARWDTYADLAEASPFLDDDRERAEAWATALLWAGDPGAALARVFPTLEAIHATDHVCFAGDLFVLAARALADLAAAHGGRAAPAAVTADWDRLDALRRGARSDPFRPGRLPVTAQANGWSWQAEVSHLRGASDPAAWDAAAQAWTALSRPHRAAYAGWRQAEALLARRHHRSEAGDVLRRALDRAAGHVPLTTALHDLAHRARIDVSTAPATAPPPADPPGTGFGLSERELEVLRLVADGRSNAEIGAELFISPRTASVHVSNILRKLDVDTRVHAATVAHRTGLLVD